MNDFHLGLLSRQTFKCYNCPEKGCKKWGFPDEKIEQGVESFGLELTSREWIKFVVID